MASYPACVTYKDGKIKEMRVTSSLIKSVLKKNELLNTCPKKVYETYLTGNKNNIATDSMQKGLFFESLAIGAGRAGKKLLDLPRLTNGDKSIAQKRIEEQAEIFPLVTSMYGMIIIKEGEGCNVQVTKRRELEVEAFPDVKFYLHAGLDIITPIEVKNTIYKFDLAVVDLKLTLNRESEHGDYCWGLPQYMDHTQLVLYSAVTGLPSFYLVFDYKPTGRGHILLPVSTPEMFINGRHEGDEEMYLLAKRRSADLRVSIKTTIETIMKWDHEGYPENPTYDNCTNCPLSPVYNGTCQFTNAIKRI